MLAHGAATKKKQWGKGALPSLRSLERRHRREGKWNQGDDSGEGVKEPERARNEAKKGDEGKEGVEKELDILKNGKENPAEP